MLITVISILFHEHDFVDGIRILERKLVDSNLSAAKALNSARLFSSKSNKS